LSSDNCFVSAMSSKKLDHIHKKYYEEEKIEKTYIGIDYDMFNWFPKETTVKDRILKFNQYKFIPKKLEYRVQKESIQKYLDICHIVDRKEFDLKTKWHFLTAPVKKNN